VIAKALGKLLASEFLKKYGPAALRVTWRRVSAWFVKRKGDKLIGLLEKLQGLTQQRELIESHITSLKSYYGDKIPPAILEVIDGLQGQLDSIDAVLAAGVVQIKQAKG
jgi:hypothetical protein